MADAPTTAPTPEELAARVASSFALHGVVKRLFCEDIAAAIRQHSEAAEARATTAEAALVASQARETAMREALERADRSLSYPVCTTIRPEGFDVKTDEDTVRFVAGIIRAAIQPQEPANVR